MSGDSARRIRNVVKRVERQPVNTPPRPSKYPKAAAVLTGRHGIVTSAITACSGTTPGGGLIQFYKDDPDAAPWITDGGADVPVKNWLISAGAPVGSHVVVFRVGRFWSLVAADCLPEGGS